MPVSELTSGETDQESAGEKRLFFKCDGLGNDFIVCWRHPGGKRASPHDAVRLCDRMRGAGSADMPLMGRGSAEGVIGADGILELSQPSPDGKSGADAAMRILNSDGSEAEMCGNGLRCAALFLEVHRRELLGKGKPGEELTFETSAGIRRARVLSKVPILPDEMSELPLPLPAVVEAQMGKAVLAAGKIPMAGSSDVTAIEPEKPFIEQPVTLLLPDGRERRVIGTAVSMGNPHFVLIAPKDISDADFRVLAPHIERSAAFPERTNVELVRPDEILPDGTRAFRMTVWERGCGWTQACGTGACAAAVSLCLTGRALWESPIEIRMPGGALRIEVSRESLAVRLVGEARLSAFGKLSLLPA